MPGESSPTIAPGSSLRPCSAGTAGRSSRCTAAFPPPGPPPGCSARAEQIARRGRVARAGSLAGATCHRRHLLRLTVAHPSPRRRVRPTPASLQLRGRRADRQQLQTGSRKRRGTRHGRKPTRQTRSNTGRWSACASLSALDAYRWAPAGIRNRPETRTGVSFLYRLNFSHVSRTKDLGARVSFVCAAVPRAGWRTRCATS